eukprot:4059460-Amphidinium_carterae.1
MSEIALEFGSLVGLFRRVRLNNVIYQCFNGNVQFDALLREKWGKTHLLYESMMFSSSSCCNTSWLRHCASIGSKSENILNCDAVYSKTRSRSDKIQEVA